MDLEDIKSMAVEWINLGCGSLVGGSCEHGNDNSDTIEGREFVDLLNDCLFLKKCCARQS
jgi:hypothetical protein